MSEQQAENTQITTVSTRFVDAIQKQFTAEVGTVQSFTEYERTLAQHLFLKADSALQDLEVKRLAAGKQGTPYTWQNINMRKLSLDAVHRINLGLDASIPNHIHCVPYFNKKEQKYDLDLRIGFIGKDYYKREAAIEKPINIVYELVYSTDTFKPIKKSLNNDIESYEFEVTNPFKRGDVIGGFGYIMYDEPRKNLLVLLAEADFQKSKNAAKGDTFWRDYPIEMRYKTLVHRTTEKLKLDPRKVNSKSYGFIEGQEKEGSVRREIAENANTEAIDITATVSDAEPEVAIAKDEPKDEPKEEVKTVEDGPGF